MSPEQAAGAVATLRTHADEHNLLCGVWSSTAIQQNVTPPWHASDADACTRRCWMPSCGAWASQRPSTRGCPPSGWRASQSGIPSAARCAQNWCYCFGWQTAGDITMTQPMSAPSREVMFCHASSVETCLYCCCQLSSGCVGDLHASRRAAGAEGGQLRGGQRCAAGAAAGRSAAGGQWAARHQLPSARHPAG